MNTLNYLVKNFSCPFYVSDGFRYYKIIDTCNFGCSAIELKKVQKKFINVLGGSFIDLKQCNKKKWVYFKINEPLSPSEKLLLDLEIDVLPDTFFNGKRKFEQIKMNI